MVWWENCGAACPVGLHDQVHPMLRNLNTSRLHPKYGNFNGSGLEFTVEPGRNRFDITLDPPEAESA